MAQLKGIHRIWATAERQYDDSGSHAYKDLSVFFRPKVPPNDGGMVLCKVLGQRPVSGYTAAAMVLAVDFVDPSHTVAVGSGLDWWERVWCDVGSGRPDDYTVWRVKAEKIPCGYVCLSPCFFRKVANGHDQHENDPPNDNDVAHMVVVKECYVNYVSGDKLTYIWDDQGTHAHQGVAIYTGPDGVGCFAFNNYDKPTGCFPILK